MKLIFVCSPYSGDVEYNTSRAKGYCRFVQAHGAVPYAPHLHNTQFLDERIPEEREAGISLGLGLLRKCDEMWIFGSKLSKGMLAELKAAKQMGIKVRYFSDRCEEVRENG